MTGLPIIETKANDVSAYIPTNVISITDGQCFLESDLFNSGVRPAINVGISVSRVGGSAQPKAMKKVAGQLRLNLAQFRELEAFAAFGSDLDAASKAQLGRGSRLVELLKQAQYEPQAMEREVISVWAGTTGRLDDVPVEDIRRFDAEFLDYVERNKTEILDAIRSTSDLSDDTVSVLESTIEEFKRQFSTSSGQLLVNDEPVEALEDADVDPHRSPVGAGLDHGCTAEGLPTPDPFRPGDQEDHEGDGVDRVICAIVKAQQRLDARCRTDSTRRAVLRELPRRIGVSKHPLISHGRSQERAAVLIITADRGLAAPTRQQHQGRRSASRVPERRA